MKLPESHTKFKMDLDKNNIEKYNQEDVDFIGNQDQSYNPRITPIF